MSLSIKSVVKLPSGASMPMLGFGAFMLKDALTSCGIAYEAGYRHVDTARMYNNEAEVAESFRKAGIKRSDIFVTTKLLSHEHGLSVTKRSINDSLKSCDLDFFDLVLLHDPKSGKKGRLEAYRALVDAQKEGKIKDIGISNFGVPHMKQLAEADLPTPAVNQIELHPWCQQKDIVTYCREKGIVVEAYCPLVRNQKMDDPTLMEVAKACKKDPAQVLVRWSLQRGFVPLPKSDTPSRIKSNSEVYDFEIPRNLMDKLDALDEGSRGAISWNPVNAA